MKKYTVETYYTCTFKTIHTLDNLDDTELSKIDQRNDGEVEVIDVKLNNRKTKKIGGKKVDNKSKSSKVENVLIKDVTDQNKKNINQNNNLESSINLRLKNNSRFKMQD